MARPIGTRPAWGVSRLVPGYQPSSGVREELAAVIRTGGDHRGVLPGRQSCRRYCSSIRQVAIASAAQRDTRLSRSQRQFGAA